MQDILAVDVSPSMIEALQQRVGPSSSLGNDACVRTWLGDVNDVPGYQVSGRSCWCVNEGVCGCT